MSAILAAFSSVVIDDRFSWVLGQVVVRENRSFTGSHRRDRCGGHCNRINPRRFYSGLGTLVALSEFKPGGEMDIQVKTT
jgi:hypothetical protein